VRKYKSPSNNRQGFQKPKLITEVIIVHIHKQNSTFNFFYQTRRLMLTIISGTNRSQSMTLKVAEHTIQIAQSMNKEAKLLDLSTFSNDFIGPEHYSADAMPTWLKDLQAELMIPATHFLFISPEYNGSIPGYLKLFIDAISVHQLKETFVDKYAGLIGVSSGRAGNLRGMDHLTSILNHVNCNVVPNHLPISGIGSIIDKDGQMQDNTKTAIEDKLKALMAY